MRIRFLLIPSALKEVSKSIPVFKLFSLSLPIETFRASELRATSQYIYTVIFSFPARITQNKAKMKRKLSNLAYKHLK
jgi:hypothetical protein